MAAYLIGEITVKNREKWEEYVAGVADSLKPYAARVVFRGRRAAVLAGSHPHELTVVIEFTDQTTLQSWFSSPDYQKLIPLRDAAADVVIVSYDAMPA